MKQNTEAKSTNTNTSNTKSNKEKGNNEKLSKSPRFRTQFSKYHYPLTPNGGGKNLTTPDMGLTPRQLLDRHSRGMSLGVPMHEAQWFEEQEVPVFKDITERHEFYKEQQESIEEIQETIKQEIAEAKTLQEQKQKQKDLETYERIKEQLKHNEKL